MYIYICIYMCIYIYIFFPISFIEPPMGIAGPWAPQLGGRSGGAGADRCGASEGVPEGTSPGELSQVALETAPRL